MHCVSDQSSFGLLWIIGRSPKIQYFALKKPHNRLLCNKEAQLGNFYWFQMQAGLQKQTCISEENEHKFPACSIPGTDKMRVQVWIVTDQQPMPFRKAALHSFLCSVLTRKMRQRSSYSALVQTIISY